MRLPTTIFFFLIIGCVNAQLVVPPTYSWPEYNCEMTGCWICTTVTCASGHLVCPPGTNYSRQDVYGDVCIPVDNSGKLEVVTDINVAFESRNDTGEDAATIKVSTDDFFGSCDNTKINNLDIGEFGVCIGNFLNPTIPNPLILLQPVYSFWDDLTSFNVDSVGDFIGDVLQTPLKIVGLVLSLIFGMIQYLLVFVFKFLLVYLLYVSLGFQALIRYFDTNSSGLNSEQKIQSTFAVMIVATIFTLAYGGGWITW